MRLEGRAEKKGEVQDFCLPDINIEVADDAWTISISLPKQETVDLQSHSPVLEAARLYGGDF